jgi:hypothetical protein
MARFRFHPAVHMQLSTFFFALMNLCIKFVPHIPAVELILFRSLISLILSYALIRHLGLKPLGNNRKFLLLRGFFGMLSLTTPLAQALAKRCLCVVVRIHKHRSFLTYACEKLERE